MAPRVVALLFLAGCGGVTEQQRQSATGRTDYPILIYCTSMSELCSPDFTVTITTTSKLDIEYIAATSHCGDARVLVSIDGALRYTSGFIGPGASTGTSTLGPIAAGEHVISVRAEGRTGGCNVGYVGSWAGTLRVTT